MKKELIFNRAPWTNACKFIMEGGDKVWICSDGLRILLNMSICSMLIGHKFKLTVADKRFRHSKKITVGNRYSNYIKYYHKGYGYRRVSIYGSLRDWAFKNFRESTNDKPLELYIRIDWL